MCVRKNVRERERERASEGEREREIIDEGFKRDEKGWKRKELNIIIVVINVHTKAMQINTAIHISHVSSPIRTRSLFSDASSLSAASARSRSVLMRCCLVFFSSVCRLRFWGAESEVRERRKRD